MALQDLNELGWAALADQEISRAGGEQDLAVESMRHFYDQFMIRGRPAGQDPGLSGILLQAEQGAAQGHGVGPLLGSAVHLYSKGDARTGFQGYEQHYNTTTLAEIRASIVATGFNAFRPGFDAFVNANPNLTYEQLVQRINAAGANPNVDDIKAYQQLHDFEVQKFRGQMYPKLVTERTLRKQTERYP